MKRQTFASLSDIRRGLAMAWLALIMAVPAAFAQIADQHLLHASPASGDAIGRGVLQLREAAIDVFVELDEPSVARYVREQETLGRGRPDAGEQRGQAQRIAVQQRNFRRDVESMGVHVQSEMRVAANGLRVRATPRQIREMQSMPGVRSIRSVEHHVPLNISSVPWIGAPEVWDSPGVTGQGVTIGIIDTGIDYFHAAMGGSGDPADYAANDPTFADPAFFPNDKVVGGIDFVGTAYNAGDPLNNVPMPDDDPVDENGHGTHVAGTAAGMSTAFVGTGVARDAELFALKVFGVGGSTAVTADAIEFSLDPNQDGSIDDALDVINMSLGSNFGDPNSVSSLAAQNASELGVIVVSSAGNAGNVPYVLGSPAAAPDSIAVAASVSGNRSRPNLVISAPAGSAGEYVGVEGAGPVRLDDVAPIAGTLVPAVPLLGCESLTNAAAIDGNIAFMVRGVCAFDTKYQIAQAAGATAIVVFNDVGAPIVMGGITSAVTIPGAMISQADGNAILDGAANDDIEAVLDAVADDSMADSITGFSSRGPGAGGSGFKPDLTAPGEAIVSAAVGSGTGAFSLSGTSMAAPHIAGVAAVMRELHPTLSPAAIKALIMNSTETSFVDGVGGSIAFPITAQGTGVVRLNRAVALTSYAKPAGIGFGRINPVSTETVNREIRVKNLANTRRHFDVEHVPSQALSDVEVRILGPSRINVSPGGESVVRVELKMKVDSTPPDPGNFSQREVDGWFIFDDGVDRLRVGYHAVVDPASRMAMSSDDDQGTASIRNAGRVAGVAQGFTLAGRGEEVSPGIANAVDAFGYRTVGANQIQFAVATEQPWESMSSLFFFIDIDTTLNGVPDFTLIAADLNALTGAPGADGRVVTAIFPATGAGTLLFFANADINDRVGILPFFLTGELGFLPPGQTVFNYTLEVFDRRNGNAGIQTGQIDLTAEVGLIPTAFALPSGASQTVTADGPGTAMWLFPNDQAPAQMQTQSID